jgi:hypothetical protein
VAANDRSRRVGRCQWAGISCFVREGLSDTLSTDHAKDTVLPLFPFDDVLRPSICARFKPRPEPVQTGFEFGDAGGVFPAASR